MTLPPVRAKLRPRSPKARFVLSADNSATRVQPPSAHLLLRLEFAGGSRPSRMDRREHGSSTILAGSVSPTAAEPPSLGARASPSRWRIGTVVPRNRSASPQPSLPTDVLVGQFGIGQGVIGPDTQ